ncbi:alpha/beta hydrolase family protein [Hyunsoonleella pacifica]|uniref:Alpha/beta hydrolase n=1 Tax=Hyunsoonleella pacifica TaxID=1080224 RepID=A0A4Q9FM64_9FLAO|nr:alpha/beta hydrolase [Hyunsoonleella pacifica]TBN15408.1 alpha/beta hydrolase [Hyunsoonleella pacifica]GGD23840.1 alpha/beta hydrolase [Hyunsoonleella pacifica]
MSQDIIHVYLMPGMAASPLIFEHIKLPEHQFKIHKLEWFIPFDNELLSNYAFRMTKKIKHDNPVLLGVSFGGILVQEMQKHIRVKKLIIVSSVKSKHELPLKMQLAKSTGAYKLVPTQLANKIEVFEKYAFGKTMAKRLELYKKYLSVNDPKYLSWAIKQVVCWEQGRPNPDVIHIHGDKDPVFPIKHINNCIIVKGGTHIAIINKYKWFNENLPNIIL